MEFLDKAFNTLILAFMRGYNNLGGWINGLLGLIFLVDLLFLAVKWMLGMKDIKETGAKVLNYAIWFLATLIFPYFMSYIQKIFTLIGLAAGTEARVPIIEKLMSAQHEWLYEIQNGVVITPGAVLAQGIVNAQPLITASNNAFFDIGARFFYMICWFLMMFSYVIMTVQYLVTYIEFSVLIGIGGIFIPFGLMQETRYLAEKFLGAATGHGVKIMLLNFIFAVGNMVLFNISDMLADNLKPDTILTAITVSVLFMMLAQNIPAMAVGILSGSPALNDAHFANTLRTVGAAAGALKTAGKVASFAARGGLQGGVSVAGGLAKAIAAGNSVAASNNRKAMGFGSAGNVAGWVSGAGLSGLQSFTGSLVSGTSKAFHSMMWGKDSKYMQQLQKPDSLRTIGQTGAYLQNRFNQGKQMFPAANTKQPLDALGKTKNIQQPKLPPSYSGSSAVTINAANCSAAAPTPALSPENGFKLFL